MLRSALLLLALPLPALAVPPALSDLAFLKGAWEAEPDASGARGAFTLEEGLGGKVLVRRNTLNTPAREDRPASSHEDLMVVSLDQDALKADDWDNEGHVIHNAIATAPGQAVFTSRGPGFRLTDPLRPQDRLEIAFDIAPPGSPDAFRPYLRDSPPAAPGRSHTFPSKESP